MQYSREEIIKIMNDKKYPLTLKYDPDWILENSMGSHCLWLQESLTQVMHLKPEMRILDMGCGKAVSSIFLAKEFGVQVWATDLWISATDNYQRINKMNMENMVFPIHADVKDLPYANDFFDAMVSINSIFFYATDENFLKNNLLKHVKPGGEIGIIVPGFRKEFHIIPEKLKPFWTEDISKWHSVEWWTDHFNRSGMVDIVLADTLPENEGNMIYNRSCMIMNAHEEEFNMLIKDDVTFVRIIAKRK